MKSKVLAVIFAASSVSIACAGSGPEHQQGSGHVTVSGMSAGGAMAHQLHIAYPEVFSGAGILAGVPFGCADGSLATAMARCMGKADGSLSAPGLADQIRTAAQNGHIGDPSMLKDDPVWLFHGTQDFVVAEVVSDVLGDLYGEFIPEEQVVYINEVLAAHTFPADDAGNSCLVPKSPFVGSCDYDAAGALLQHLYPGLNAPADHASTELVKVRLANASQAGLSEDAYLFTPAACADSEKDCKLHLVLHGCLQSATQVGTTFIEQSGYLAWAETNDIILAFPQVVAGASNPYACWDWWGYTGENYRWRSGPQISVLVNWINSLSPGSLSEVTD